MTEEELNKILEMPSAAIIAPAGHGKTEMIVDIVSNTVGKQLLLTHTNAGVDAIKKRLKKRKISVDKYTITTIAAFCTKWCKSYYFTGSFDKNLTPLGGRSETTAYYSQLYTGAKKILETDWAGKVLKSTYTGFVVDEYQDCIQEQHEIMLAMNKHLPIRVFGDPMQGIFFFAGNLVDWTKLEFPIVDVQTQPWRWIKCNPELGDYLIQVRKTLLPALDNRHCTIRIDETNKSVKVVSPTEFSLHLYLKEFTQFSSVVFITKWPKQQLKFCIKIPGFFQYDEKQDCEELFQYAKRFDDKKDAELILDIIDFAAICSTRIKIELKSYIDNLKKNNLDFSRIKKNMDFKNIVETNSDETKKMVYEILKWISSNQKFKKYRTELLNEMIRSVSYAIDHNIDLYDAAIHIRNDAFLQRRYTSFKYLSSRTLLSKGLEFDCVIIDMTTPLSARDFYVAMTRSMKKIYILSDTNVFHF